MESFFLQLSMPMIFGIIILLRCSIAQAYLWCRVSFRRSSAGFVLDGACASMQAFDTSARGFGGNRERHRRTG